MPETYIDLKEKSYNVFQTFTSCIKLMKAACRTKEIVYFFAGLLSAAFPSVLILLQKRFFTQAGILANNSSSQVLYTITGILVAWSILNLLNTLINMASSYASEIIQRRVSDYAAGQMLRKYGRVAYEVIESPEIHNKYRWIVDQSYRFSIAIAGVLGIVYGFITLISAGAVAFSEDWVIAAVIIAGSIPACIFITLQNEEEYHQYQWEAPELREQNDKYTYFFTRESLREMRIGMYANYLTERWRVLSERLRKFRYELIRKFMFYNILSNIFSNLGVIIALWIICTRIYNPNADKNIGSFILIYSVAQTMQNAIVAIFSNISGMSVTGMYLHNYDTFTSYRDENRNGSELPVPDEAVISFNNVSFAYPGTDRLVLKDISVTVKQGEKIAIVGENGSGKTTFVSLLAGLFQPTSGNITFNEHNINSCLGLVRKSISFMQQEFGKYNLTIGDSIAIGDLSRDTSYQDWAEAAKLSHADDFINQLKDGYDTYIGTLEEGQANLSGGQWQKLAFARALLKKDARVMVLDEQTAALDPLSEAQFYSEFKDITKDRTAIMISHRLGSTKLADRILVFNNGQIVEEGNHSQLMARCGLYAKMYNAQAQWYI